MVVSAIELLYTTWPARMVPAELLSLTICRTTEGRPEFVLADISAVLELFPDRSIFIWRYLGGDVTRFKR